ncbi:hypothetical protein [Pedobacter sp. FW305-3-2-15-E-R2A2]|jgi:hypothetical protein|uniref:hypothetical protein n=1 Tax=Pedobacter sp. FW305-3-2-15-E-R2A2 TaxID=3140251 RepID=UPI003140367B
MRLLQLKNNLLTRIAFMLLAVGLISACSKDKDKYDDPRAGYPKTVTIDYKVTQTAGNVGLTDIRYTNETGAFTSLDNQALPFSKKITKKVEFGESATISTYTAGPGTIKLEILVDGKVVETASPVSNTYINHNISYQFK